MTYNIVSKILYTLSPCPEVLQHSVRVAHIAGATAAKFGLPWSEGYWLAGLAHDLGKLSWPPELHQKVGLTAEDWSMIHVHPVQSMDYLLDIAPDIGKLVTDAVLHHHERPGGNGYPEGAEPTISALVVAVADCFDALTSSRPYRNQPFSPVQALNEVARWAPPELVEALFSGRPRR